MNKLSGKYVLTSYGPAVEYTEEVVSASGVYPLMKKIYSVSSYSNSVDRKLIKNGDRVEFTLQKESVEVVGVLLPKHEYLQRRVDHLEATVAILENKLNDSTFYKTTSL